MTQRAKEMRELAEAGLRHAEGLTAQLSKQAWWPNRAHIEQSRNSIKKLAKALRLAAQADAPGGEPAAVKATPYWTCSTCDAPLSCAECGVEQPNDSMYYDSLIVENKRLRDLASAAAHEIQSSDGGGKSADVPAQMQESNDCGLAQDAGRPEDTTQGDRPAHPVTCPPSETNSILPQETLLQSRGRHYDIIVEAIASYNEWLRDDDFDAFATLKAIMGRMRERVSMTDAPQPPQQGVREAVVAECARVAFEAYGSITSSQYAMEGPAGLAKRMITAIKGLAALSEGKPGGAVGREEIARILAEKLWSGATFDNAQEYERQAFLKAADAVLSVTRPVGNSPDNAEGGA